MKIGKVSNAVLNRSVLKYTEKGRGDILASYPGVGNDASVFKAQKGQLVVSTDCGIEPVYTAANNIYARGGKPCAAQLCVILPESCREIRLKEVMSKLSADCSQLGIEISGGHTQVVPGTGKPLAAVTAVGWRYAGEEIFSDGTGSDGAFADIHGARTAGAYAAMPGEDIIMTKYIGIGGIRYIIDSRRDEILKKYTEELIEKAYGTRADLSVEKEARIAAKSGVSAMHDMSQGGVYAALWDMAESSGLGLDIDLRAIAVRQEIIEICEMFDINPYQLNSCGSLLMTSGSGEQVVAALKSEGVEACIIGRTTGGNDRVLHNLEELRYLEKPAPDEVYRFGA
jgi:hydrogenase expression/formation protein HypE